MIYFRVLNPTKPSDAFLGSIAKKELSYYMEKYPNETFLTDEVTMAEVTVAECYGDSIYVRGNGYEGKVRDELKSVGKVIYQVTPVFRDNELLPRGFQLQAISEDESLNFNVYIYNVMNGLSFNYSDGSSTVDKTMTVK